MKIKDLILYGLCIISMATATVSVVRSHVIQGEQGIQGEVGPKGDKGDKGEDGLNGLNGLDGKDGKDGRDGIDGINGLDGKDGADGAKGDKGDTGATGAKGEKGDKGDTGEKGKDGQTPYIGENGNWWIGDSDTGVLAEGQIYVTSSYYTWENTTKEFYIGSNYLAWDHTYFDFSGCKLEWGNISGTVTTNSNVRNINAIWYKYSGCDFIDLPLDAPFGTTHTDIKRIYISELKNLDPADYNGVSIEIKDNNNASIWLKSKTSKFNVTPDNKESSNTYRNYCRLAAEFWTIIR